MKSLALLFVTLSSAYGARLDNTYIPPPPSAAYAGGQGLVQAPKHGPSQQQYGFSQQPRPSSGTFRQAQPQYQSGPSSYQPQAGPSSYQPPSQPQYQGRNNYQQPSGPPIPILKFVNNPNGGDGAYNFEYLTGNGISHEERGYNKPLGPELGEQVVEGSYSYTADDGQQITVTYTADANGFHAQGDHLPTPPPIPDEIAESLKLTAPGYNPYDYASTGPARSATFPQNNQPSYSQNGYGQQPGNYGAAPKTAYNPQGQQGYSPQGQQGYNQPQPQPQYSSHSSQSAYSSRGPARPSNAYIPPPSYRK